MVRRQTVRTVSELNAAASYSITLRNDAPEMDADTSIYILYKEICGLKMTPRLLTVEPEEMTCTRGLT